MAKDRGANERTHEREGGEDDLQAIDRLREAHVAALNAGNASGWAELFTEDGVQLPPNAPANHGRAAIGAWTQALVSQFAITFALLPEEVRVLGDWAFERGRYTIAMKPSGATRPSGSSPTVHDSGKYVTLYRRNEDGWLMARDIWNSNHPLPRM